MKVRSLQLFVLLLSVLNYQVESERNHIHLILSPRHTWSSCVNALDKYTTELRQV